MNNTVLPPDEAKAIAKLQQLYLKTERKLINEITRKRSLKLVDYAEVAALERVQRILGEMQSESFKYVPLMVETIFQGVNKKDTAGYENARTLTTAQTATSQILVNNLLGQVMEAAAMAQKSAEKWLALGRLEGDEFREAALSAVAEQQAAGASWILAQKNMAVDLEAQGITAFVDRAGRKWSLTDYCNMAVRTTARQSFVAAKLTADDHDLWQIVRIGSTCPLCATYEGRIYSKSGTDPDYPPLATAFGKIDPKGANNLENTYLNIHPNCLHSLIKYTTIGKTDEQIQKDKDFSSFEKNPADHDPRTKRQREEYRKKEQNRQKLLNDTRQWNRYRAALGKDCPDYETFLKHKRLDDDLYKKLEKQYREVRREAKKAVEEVNDGLD